MPGAPPESLSMRLLLDASVVVTYLASRDPNLTAVHVLLESADGEQIVLVWTDAIAAEVERTVVTRRPLARRVPVVRLRSVIDGIWTIADVLPALIGPYPPVCRDPNDDYLVAGALAGRADLVVTLDDDLLALGEHAGVRFVKPGGALAILRDAGLLPPD